MNKLSIKLFFCSMVLITVLCCFVSCNPDKELPVPEGTSSTTGSFRIVDYSKPAGKSDLAIGQIKIVAVDSSGNKKEFSAANVPVNADNLTTGNWTYSFECFDTNGDIIASKDNLSIEVKPLTRTSVFVELEDSDYKDLLFGISKDTGYVRVRPFSKTDNSLASLTIPEKVDGITVRGIAINGFKGCTKITSIASLPSTLTVIGDSAFEGCTGLTSVNIPNTIASMGSKVFKGCTGLTSATLGTGIAMINTSAFEGCSKLESVTMNGSITSIGSRAFANCSKLVFTIPSTVSTIKASAFENCTSLTTVTMPSSVKFLENRVFYNCNKLATINLTNSIESIGEYAFYNTAITTIELPVNNKYIRIAPCTFHNCRQLSSIVIPEQITDLGWGAFSECTALTSIVIPDKVKAIGAVCFNYCTTLSSVTIGEKVETLYNKCFRYCSALETITIPASVKNIEYFIFQNCSDITINFESKKSEVLLDNLWLYGCSEPTVNWEVSL